MTQEKQKPIVSIISYNAVQGYKPGWYEGNSKRVFIHANRDGDRGCDTGQGSNDRKRAQSVMASLRHSYYGALEVPVENVEHYYVYAGLNAMQSALDMAKSLHRMSGVPVTVYACHCDWNAKKEILFGSNIDLIDCECGGRTSLAALADELLKF